ncbi:MAG: HAD hydrolase-like protein [Patescibacteria group bacterium]
MIDKKVYLFDWDGCLADTLSIWLAGYYKVFNEFGLHPSDLEIAKIFGDWKGPEKLGISDTQGFITKLLTEVQPKLSDVKLNPNAKEVLTELKKRNKKIAVLTSSKKEDVYPRLEKYNLLSLIDCFLAMEDVIKHKPDPEVINKATEILKADKNGAIIIGDGDKDIVCGQNAGITTVLYYPLTNSKFYKEEDLKKLNADYLIRDFLELATL